MAYSAKPPNAPEHHLNGNKVLYSSGAKSTASASKKPSARHIPQVRKNASLPLGGPSLNDVGKKIRIFYFLSHLSLSQSRNLPFKIADA